jgi:hypothetical protein
MDFKETSEKVVEILKTRNEFILSFVMFTAYTIILIHYLGIIYGFLASIVSSYIGYHYWNYLMNKPKKDLVEVGIINKKHILIFVMLSFTFYVGYLNFNDYFINPEIIITSHNSGETIIFSKDKTFEKISGTSHGLANNEFSHLFILYRRVDSNQVSSGWNWVSDPCTVYKDGSWECRFQLQDLYAEWINETLIVKSPNNSSNNISTNVDIVALIARQTIGHSILTKLITSANEVNDLSPPDWALPGLLFLKLGEGTFYDEDYELDFGNDDSFPYFNNRISLPKHLADSHVTITPVITESYNLTGNPYGLLVYFSHLTYLAYSVPNDDSISVYDVSIPADNVGYANFEVQIIDKEHNFLHSEGRIVNLTTTKGNLSETQITTDSEGRGSVSITSGEIGLGIISAQSPGLEVANNEMTEIMFFLPHVVVEFNQWINSSSKDGETSELIANFQTKHDDEYLVTLTACGTEIHWPFKSEEWPKGRVEVDGIVLKEIEINTESIMEFRYENVRLIKGNHTLKINMTNSLEIPLIGSRNLYIEQVEFS